MNNLKMVLKTTDEMAKIELELYHLHDVAGCNEPDAHKRKWHYRLRNNALERYKKWLRCS